jgi:polyisoprenoid-binding protein YceI
MKTALFSILIGATSLFGASSSAMAEALKYTLDPSHSQIVFSYNHAGFSRSYGMFSGFEGEIMFDQANPAASSVSVTIPAASMITGWDARAAHLLQSGDFFKLDAFPDVTFASTGIEVTGETTALITGDLTLNGVTQPVVLDAVLNTTGEYPFPPFQGKPGAGFSATTTVMRSAFDLGLFAPFISDEVTIELSIEAIAME